MPNRMIKETLRTSRNVSSLTDFQFRIWVLLITYVDDYGRGNADPELLKSLLFPRKHSVSINQIQNAIKALDSKGMITLYDFDGETYFYFPKWADHQRIRQKVSKFPEPPAICSNPPQLAAGLREKRPETKPNQVEVEVETNRNQLETNARARVSNSQPDVGRVMEYFLDRVNPSPSPLAIEMLKKYTEELSADVVIHALGIALDERKTGWRYIQGILQRYKKDGLNNMEAVLQAEREHDNRKRNGETNNIFAQIYQEEYG